MTSRIEALAARYGKHIKLPWPRTVAGSQRVIMIVYDKELERSMRARKAEFEQRTGVAGHKYKEFDCTCLFADWMARDEYREAYFENPRDLALKLESDFTDHVAGALRDLLQENDDNTVVAVTGVASLYGFIRVSNLVRAVEPDIKGRLVIFFPGTKEANNYRLLDARDGWNYLALSITIDDDGGAL